MQERKTTETSRYNYNAIILCALVFFCDRRGQFFVWSQTVRRQAEAEKGAEQLVSRTTAETQAVAGTIRTAVEKQRAISSSVQPGCRLERHGTRGR